MSTTPATPITDRFRPGDRVIITTPDPHTWPLTTDPAVCAILGVVVAAGRHAICGPAIDIRPLADVNEEGDMRPYADDDAEAETWSVFDTTPYGIGRDELA